MRRAKANKDPFKDLDEDFKSTILASSPDEILVKISYIALNQEDLMKAQKEDQDLAEAKERAKEAGAGYREGTKMNKLRIAFAKRVLEDKGKL